MSNIEKNFITHLTTASLILMQFTIDLFNVPVWKIFTDIIYCFSFQISVEMFDYLDNILDLQAASKCLLNH